MWYWRQTTTTTNDDGSSTRWPLPLQVREGFFFFILLHTRLLACPCLWGALLRWWTRMQHTNLLLSWHSLETQAAWSALATILCLLHSRLCFNNPPTIYVCCFRSYYCNQANNSRNESRAKLLATIRSAVEGGRGSNCYCRFHKVVLYDGDGESSDIEFETSASGQCIYFFLIYKFTFSTEFTSIIPTRIQILWTNY